MSRAQSEHTLGTTADLTLIERGAPAAAALEPGRNYASCVAPVAERMPGQQSSTWAPASIASTSPTDRYGRVPAFAFVGRDDGPRSLQAEMLAAGHARVGARVGSHDCAADLLAQEKRPAPPSLACGTIRTM